MKLSTFLKKILGSFSISLSALSIAESSSESLIICDLKSNDIKIIIDKKKILILLTFGFLLIVGSMAHNRPAIKRANPATGNRQPVAGKLTFIVRVSVS
jgi:hypothetical protein